MTAAIVMIHTTILLERLLANSHRWCPLKVKPSRSHYSCLESVSKEVWWSCAQSPSKNRTTRYRSRFLRSVSRTRLHHASVSAVSMARQSMRSSEQLFSAQISFKKCSEVRFRRVAPQSASRKSSYKCNFFATRMKTFLLSSESLPTTSKLAKQLQQCETFKLNLNWQCWLWKKANLRVLWNLRALASLKIPTSPITFALVGKSLFRSLLISLPRTAKWQTLLLCIAWVKRMSTLMLLDK